MTSSQGLSRSAPESDLLKRLRNAVRTSGLTADLDSLEGDERPILVTNRLAQTTVRYLTHEVDAVVGQMLTEELRSLGSPEEYKLLMEERGFTFFHLIQFLYEFAKAHVNVPDRELFCLGMGSGGGGIEVEPYTEVVSLVRLLINALQPGRDSAQLGILMRELGPLILAQIFPLDLFRIEIEPDGENRLHISFRYTDSKAVGRLHVPYELDDDIGAFFLNSSLHIQGALELGWEIFAENASRDMTVKGLIEERSTEEISQIAGSCRCEWSVSWRPDASLRRAMNDSEVMALAGTVYEALSRKDLEYYVERIKHLETRVRDLETGGRGDLRGTSEPMHRLYEMIDRVAESDLAVLVRGESGTGKELVARVLHDLSPRRDKPFVAVNCAAFSETLLESELFGHEKGAFTGADRLKPGRFELAHGGTLLLDEVGDLPLTTQVKLLRALETQAFERVGGTETIQTDVRIIGATNRNLEALIEQGDFREDFFFRLHVLPLEVPPLRNHPEDIPMLAQHFLEAAAERSGKDVRSFSRAAIRQLVDHRWPGNVRELQHAVERAVVVYSSGPTLTDSDIRLSLGLREVEPEVLPMNARQREIVRGVKEGATTVIALLEAVSSSGRVEGQSRRTLQNDLKKLLELGYLTYEKEGSVRHYRLGDIAESEI